MEIRDIFVKDLTRPITGVVLVEQEEIDIIWQELDEFIVTGELYKHFAKFVEAYLQGRDSHINPEY